MNQPMMPPPMPSDGILRLAAIHQCDNSLCEKYDVSQVITTEYELKVIGGSSSITGHACITCVCGRNLQMIDMLVECSPWPVEANRNN